VVAARAGGGTDAAGDQSAAIELADTVIRELFGIGLVLQGRLPQVSGPDEQRLTAAVEGIDRVVRTIRDAVFAWGPTSPPQTPSARRR
jgi:hypothetical protein